MNLFTLIVTIGSVLIGINVIVYLLIRFIDLKLEALEAKQQAEMEVGY